MFWNLPQMSEENELNSLIAPTTLCSTKLLQLLYTVRLLKRGPPRQLKPIR